jgi:hypothetical protein
MIERNFHQTHPYRLPEKSGNLSGLKWLNYILLIITLSNPAFSQFAINVSKVSTTAAPFLEIEAGSRAVGMGSAFVAVANDATAFQYIVLECGRPIPPETK